ncbi:MAG: type 2 isopentenyl-diphosphate Delta-isomerase [Candidatus Anstonellales archaeon]
MAKIKTGNTESRKKQHVELVAKQDVEYSSSAGFEDVLVLYNALPELNADSVDLSTNFLGKKLKLPLLITGMTGGYGDAERINKSIAEVAERKGLAMGLGSQRAMIEKPELFKTYYVRDVAPKIPLLANIGAFQLKKYSISQIESLVSKVEADALAIHINPMQEYVQPEGDRDFSGVLHAIKRIASKVRVVVKEVGGGISREVALKLFEAGAEYVDVSGAGGTSWSKVEMLRGGLSGFEEFGIPTADAIIMCKGTGKLIGSGGIRNGIDAMKAVLLGAEVAGTARPFLLACLSNNLPALVEEWEKQMKGMAFLTGSRNLKQFRKAHYILKGQLAQRVEEYKKKGLIK